MAFSWSSAYIFIERARALVVSIAKALLQGSLGLSRVASPLRPHCLGHQARCYEPLDVSVTSEVRPAINVEIEPEYRSSRQPKAATVGERCSGGRPSRLVADDQEHLGVPATVTDHVQHVIDAAVKALSDIDLARPSTGPHRQFQSLLGAHRGGGDGKIWDLTHRDQEPTDGGRGPPPSTGERSQTVLATIIHMPVRLGVAQHEQRPHQTMISRTERSSEGNLGWYGGTAPGVSSKASLRDVGGMSLKRVCPAGVPCLLFS
jgi:hypothetical protein